MNDLEVIAALLALARTLPRGALRITVGMGDPYSFTVDPGDVPTADRNVDVSIDLKISAPESMIRDAMTTGLIGVAATKYLRDAPAPVTPLLVSGKE